MEYSGFWLRFVATIIDTVIFMLVIYLIFMVMGADFMPDFERFAAMSEQERAAYEAEMNEKNLIPNLISWVFMIIYKVGMEASAFQGTVGKIVLGLKVTDINGERIGVGRSIGRYLASILSYLIVFIGYIMVAFTGRKQGLHDMIAGTLVVKSR